MAVLAEFPTLFWLFDIILAAAAPPLSYIVFVFDMFVITRELSIYAALATFVYYPDATDRFF